jgi:hypothetical protein
MSRRKKKTTNKQRASLMRQANSVMRQQVQEASRLLLMAKLEIESLRASGTMLFEENMRLKEKLGLIPQVPDEEDLALPPMPEVE